MLGFCKSVPVEVLSRPKKHIYIDIVQEHGALG